MSETLKHASELAYNLDELTNREFGAAVQTPELVLPGNALELKTQPHELVNGGELVPVGANFASLTHMAGRTFGLLTNDSGKLQLFPGIITSRTSSDRVHFTYLEDPMDPGNVQELTTLQTVMLRGGLNMQDGSVGTEHSHNSAVSTATEIGHTAMAMRALTDSATLQAVKNRSHIVHDWGHSSAGIAPNLTTRGAERPGAFDMETASGRRTITFKSVEITQRSPYVLVTSPAFETSAGSDDSKLVIGVGLLAARQHHGQDTNDQLTRIMSRI